MLLVYVDDILVMGNDPNYISSLILDLHRTFDMKHLGRLNHFLGIEFKPEQSGYFFISIYLC